MIDTTAAAFALLLGAVAAFNPCGFALLPAYIAVIVTGTAEGDTTRLMALRRAIVFGLAMTVGFVAVFAGFGLVFVGINSALQGYVLPYLPYVTIVLGVVLVTLGITMVLGHEVQIPGLRMTPGALAGRAPGRAVWSQVLYGVSFALASLSCTIGPFFAVVTQALDARNAIGTVSPFVVYGAGMGTSVVLVSIAAAFAGTAVGRVLRSRTGLIMRIGGALMIVSGIYVVLYGLAEVFQLHGITALQQVLFTTSGWQGDITNAIRGWGTTVLVVLLTVTVAFGAWVFAASSRQMRSRR